METEGVQIGDLTEPELIGEGGCGAVFRVRDVAGNALALKIFDDATVNRELLEKTTRRLRAGGWPEGVLPVISEDLRGALAFRLMPLIEEAAGENAGKPRSLQHRLDEHPGIDSWKFFRALARALAAMHSRGVTHGNLKPGNVFLDGTGAPLLADWALGNMPGLRRQPFTDALIYQPPEQLRGADVCLEPSSQRCDVFAFGVLAFRLLTGKFPRCHAVFSQVAPPVGETRREGLRADLPRIAANLEAQPEVCWPEGKTGELESGMREWISRCLELDPLKRPANMVEVAAGFDVVERDLETRREREELLNQRRHAEQKLRGARFGIGMAAACVLGFAGLWQMEKARFSDAKVHHQQESVALMGDVQSAQSAKSLAENKVAEMDETLAVERKAWLASLEASRKEGDRLFTWAMEKDHRKLPPLDGRDFRLKQLESGITDFLSKTGEVPDLIVERARAHLQLAEISISAGDAEVAKSRFETALKILKSLPMPADVKFRLAGDYLQLALLLQANADPETLEVFANARQAIAAVPRDQVESSEIDRMLATLDFHEAKLLAARGDETKALEQLMRATQTLNRISALRPDSAILRSELAACRLSSAVILDDMGNPGDAADVRKLASEELRKLVEKNPDDLAPRLELAGCYGAMAEAASLASGDAETEALSANAIKLLDEVLARQPENPDAVSRKAALFGLRAGMLRDRGLASEAMKSYDEGIRMLEALRASVPGDASVSYQLALLWWQKGRMAGASGGRDEELALLGSARDLLGSLDASKQVSGPSPAQLKRSAAYLAGDLGHALQLANRKADAARAFARAVALWESLVTSHPESEEYQEGLAWSRRRMADLK